jgi:hypothetical protein
VNCAHLRVGVERDSGFHARDDRQVVTAARSELFGREGNGTHMPTLLVQELEGWRHDTDHGVFFAVQ